MIRRLTLLCALTLVCGAPSQGQDRPADASPAPVPPFLVANQFTPAQYAGAVSFAMESMRLVYGEMPPADEKKFQDKWQPLFQFCTPEVIEYFNTLNPLLGQFLGLRAAMSEAAEAFDEAQMEAVAAAVMESAEGLARAMEAAELARRELVTLQAAMEDVVNAIVALGDPPHAAEEGARRRKLHEEARRIGCGRGAGSCVRLSWREPPAGWTEKAHWAVFPGILKIGSDDDRHMFLSPDGGRVSFYEGSHLEFGTGEDPGMSAIRIRLMSTPFPELGEIEEAVKTRYDDMPKDPDLRRRLGDYRTSALGIFGNTFARNPDRVQVESTRLFLCPALRSEVEYSTALDPHPDAPDRKADSVCVIWYAVDVGLLAENVWLSVQCEMQQDDTSIPLPKDPPDSLKWVDFNSLRAWNRKRSGERWEAMKAIWEREQWYILDSIALTLTEEMPDGEEERFSLRQPAVIPPDVQTARGWPQRLNGRFIRFDDTGTAGNAALRLDQSLKVRKPRKNPKPGQSPFVDEFIKVSVRSDHSWTEPPAELEWGKEYSLQLQCPSVTFGKESEKDIQPGSGDNAAVTEIGIEFPAPGGSEGTFVKDSTSRPIPCTDSGVIAAAKKEVRFAVSRDAALYGGMRLFEVTVELGANTSRSFSREGPRERREILYVWDWMPARKSGSTGAGSAQSKPPDRDAAAAEAEKRAKLNQIEFYRAEIACRQENLEALKRQMASAKPEQREMLARQIMWEEDWLQRARDQIATLETGVYTRTRTAADAFNLSVMATESREQAEKWRVIHGLIRRGPNLIALAPPEEQAKLREFYDRQVDPANMAAGDSEQFKKVVRALGNRVMGSLEKTQAVSQERLIDAEERLQRAENVKWVAEQELMLLSLGGGTYAYGYNAFQGVTGYMEGGPGEAAKRVLKTYNKVTEVASDAMDAYQKGVVDEYERYAKNPQSGPVDEVRAGLGSVGWTVGQAVLMELGQKFVLEPVGKWMLGIPDPPRKKTLKELSQEMQYLKRRAEGMDTVQLFRDKMDDVAKAAKAGASTADIDKLQEEAEKVYKLIKTDYFAKMHLNELGRKGNLTLLRQYNAYDHFAMAQVKERFEARQAASGFKKQEYKLFSNSASAGKAGMDVDLGVIEPPRFVIDADGNRIPNPARRQWLDQLAEERIGGNVGLPDFREQSQKNLEDAFRDTFGYDPRKSAGREAFVNFTTSDHPEAYRDLAWLGKKGMKTADISNIDPEWVRQAADVSGYKVDSLPKHHPSFGVFGTLQEQCRGTVKDFDTKLAPLLKRAKNPKAVDHMRELREVMDKFAKNEMGPIDANRRILELTGGRGIGEVVEQYKTMLQGLAGN